MHGNPPSEYVLARRALLNALDALEEHAAGLTIVGAQAVYLHTGPATIAVPEYTTDADVAVAPDLIAKTPLIEEALGAAGFRRGHDPGRWLDTNGIHLDLLVPELLAGPGRRGADLGPHGRRAARRVHGLEGVLVDRELMNMGSMEAEDPRNLEVWVAGTAALIVAKTTKIQERANDPRRAVDKDALDVLRLLQNESAEAIADSLRQLQADDRSQASTNDAVEHLPTLFGTATAVGSMMAGRAAAPFEDPEVIAASVAVLINDLLDALRD